MSQYTISFETDPAAADIEIIQAGLSAFNRSAIQSDSGDESKPLNLIIRAEDGTVMGGLLGRSWWGWLYVHILWVHDDLRGRISARSLCRRRSRKG